MKKNSKKIKKYYFENQLTTYRRPTQSINLTLKNICVFLSDISISVLLISFVYVLLISFVSFVVL
jgi:hypothetical protein